MTKPLSIVAALTVLLFLGSTGSSLAAKGELIDDSAADTGSGFCDLAVVECPNETIETKITNVAKEAGIDPETALRIARCESSLNPKAQNKHSSAGGLYQFTIGTWRWIGAEESGLNRFNADDSIKMFMAWYPQNKNWWSCK